MKDLTRNKILKQGSLVGGGFFSFLNELCHSEQRDARSIEPRRLVGVGGVHVIKKVLVSV